MARVFITGSSDGLGLLAARVLIEQGHEVVCTDETRVEVARLWQRHLALEELCPVTSPRSLGQEESLTRSMSSVSSMP